MDIVAASAENTRFFLPLGNGGSDISAADFIVFEDPAKRAADDSLRSVSRRRQFLSRRMGRESFRSDMDIKMALDIRPNARDAADARSGRRQRAARARQRNAEPACQSGGQGVYDLWRLRYYGGKLSFLASEFRHAQLSDSGRKQHSVDGRSGRRVGEHHRRVQTEGIAGSAAQRERRRAEPAAQRARGVYYPAVGPGSRSLR